MLGLIRTTDTARLVWGPDASDDDERWISAQAGDEGRATVVEVRPLSALDLVRCQAGLAVPAADDAPALVEWMAAHIRAAFVGCTEGAEATDDPEVVLANLSLAQLLGLGSAVLRLSAGDPDDPT